MDKKITDGNRDKNKKTLWRIILVVLVFWIIVGALVGPKFFRKIGAFWYVDACLDRGGCWNAKEGKCETEDRSKCVQPEQPAAVP